MKQLFALISLVLLCFTVHAQRLVTNSWQEGMPDTTAFPGGVVLRARAVQGEVRRAADGAPLAGATVLLRKDTGTGAVASAVTDQDGRFRLARVAAGHYTLQVEFLGYQSLFRPVQVQQQTVALGILNLAEAATAIGEVQVEAQVPLGSQFADTTQFYAAAFKLAPDATTQDLVLKMPGMTIRNGKLQAQGEPVERVLLDGKLLFGNDADAALQSLPAELVTSVQVLDKRTDMAELTGFDDGVRIRTLNIITKPGAHDGHFGKATAGYGTENTYQLGAAVNRFWNDSRLSLTALSNNINQLTFSPYSEINGQSSIPAGLIQTNEIGLNYSNTWNEKVDLSATYAFNHRNDQTDQNMLRSYIFSRTEERESQSISRTSDVSASHRFQVQLDYELDARNRFRFRSRGNLLQTDFDFLTQSIVKNEEGPLQYSNHHTIRDLVNAYLDNQLVYSHLFNKPGRSLNLRLNSGHSSRNREGDYSHDLEDFANPQSIVMMRMREQDEKGSLGWETALTYTEAVGQYGQAALGLQTGTRSSDTNDRYFLSETATGTYEEYGSLSSVLQDEILKQEVSVGYRYSRSRLYLQAEGKLRHARLTNNSTLPIISGMEKGMSSFLPNARLRYNFSQTRHLELNYDTRSQMPQVLQLQPYVVRTNMLILRSGNPDLKQMYLHWFRARYRSHNPETNRNLYASLEAVYSDSYLGSSTRELPYNENQEEYERGRVLVSPANQAGYRVVRSYLSYGLPLAFLRSNLNLEGLLRYGRSPIVRYGQLSYTNSSSLGAGIGLSSNISERIDFNLSTRTTIDYQNSARGDGSYNTTGILNQDTRLWGNFIVGNGFVYRTGIHHQFNSRINLEMPGTTATLWNMSIGKKLLAGQLGELNVSVYDLLKQHTNRYRTVSEAYLVDVSNNNFRRYFMLNFIYNIRDFRSETK